MRLHRVVAEAFLPNPKNKPFVDHIDGRRDNNCVANLSWATPSENAKKAARGGGRQGRPVVQLTMGGKFVREWGTAVLASRGTSVARGNISMCCRGNTRLRSAGGYTWKYADDYYPPDPEEEWATVEHAGLVWEVSSAGRIKTQVYGGITRGTLVGGYFSIKNKRVGVSVAVHRLVALAFCPCGHAEQTVVNHKDGNKTNNAAANLEWVTQKENVQHASDAGLIQRRVTPVLQRRADGAPRKYPSIAEASRQTGVSAFEICGACKGRKARAGGFAWVYAPAAEREQDGEEPALPAPAAEPAGAELAPARTFTAEEMGDFVDEILTW